MKRTRLFAQAPGLERPWYVESTAFDAGERRPDIHLNFEVGGTFACTTPSNHALNRFAGLRLTA